MATAQQLHAYAVHLFALALRAREDGDATFADRLVAKAVEYLDQAATPETPAKPKK